MNKKRRIQDKEFLRFGEIVDKLIKQLQAFQIYEAYLLCQLVDKRRGEAARGTEEEQASPQHIIISDHIAIMQSISR